MSYDVVRDGEVSLVPVASDADWIELRSELERLRLCGVGDSEVALSYLSQTAAFEDVGEVTRFRERLLDARSPVVAATIAAMDEHAPDLLQELPKKAIEADAGKFRSELANCLRTAKIEECALWADQYIAESDVGPTSAEVDVNTAIESETAMADKEEANVNDQPQQVGETVEAALSSVEGELNDLTKLVASEGETDVPTAEAVEDPAGSEPVETPEVEDTEPAATDDTPIDDVIESALNESAALDDPETPSDPIAESTEVGTETHSPETADSEGDTNADANPNANDTVETEQPAIENVASPLEDEPSPVASAEPEPIAETDTTTVEDTTDIEDTIATASTDEAVQETPVSHEPDPAPAPTPTPTSAQPQDPVEPAVESVTEPAADPVAEDFQLGSEPDSQQDSPSAGDRLSPAPAPALASTRRRRRARRSGGRRTPADDVEVAINSLAAFLQDEVGELWDEVREAMEDVLADRDTVAAAREKAAALHREMQTMRDEVARARRESRQLQTQLQNLRDETTRARQRADSAACDAQNAADRAIAAAREAESTVALNDQP